MSCEFFLCRDAHGAEILWCGFLTESEYTLYIDEKRERENEKKKSELTRRSVRCFVSEGKSANRRFIRRGA